MEDSSSDSENSDIVISDSDEDSNEVSLSGLKLEFNVEFNVEFTLDFILGKR